MRVPPVTRFRAVRRNEVAIAARHGHEAFGGDPDDLPLRTELYDRHLEAGELWGVESGDGELLGHCRLLLVDHWFGGRAVPCIDVAGVAVPRVHRRRGVATAMMRGAVAWGADRGVGMSLLYGYVPPLYRPLGWEHAGTLPLYPLEVRLEAAPAEPMRPVREDDWPGIVVCHEGHAAGLNGAGRRRPRRWRQLQDAEGFVLTGPEGVDAYVIVERDEVDPPTVDWAATSPRGLRAVVATLTSLAQEEPLFARSLPQGWAPWARAWDMPAAGGRYWMARPLAFPAAVRDRGFPAGMAAAVTLTIDDPLAPESHGPWRLQIAGGRGVVDPAPRGDVSLHVRAVGPLFTGFASARQLALAGLLDGPGDALDVLDAAFAGTPPVMLDFF